jgi:hypothetical protein
VYLWEGGVTLVGASSPTATLTVPGAVTDDRLAGHGIQCADVTGDSVRDLVVGTARADIVGVAGAGAVYVWQGGATLAGGVSPTATLTVPGAVADDQLGSVSGVPQALQCAEVTGDGVLDVVVGADSADISGVVNAGAVYVWQGGATLAGAAPPTATLTVPGAAMHDLLGSGRGQTIQCAEATGDGVLDVVVGSRVADVGGTTDAGAVHVWQGGAALAGALPPTATLTVPGAAIFDALGDASRQGIQLGDLTADGVLDIVVGAQGADVGGVSDTGAAYLWAGAILPAAPTATFAIPGAVAGDSLTRGN